MIPFSRRTALALLFGAAISVSSCGGGGHGSSSTSGVACNNTPGLTANFANPGGTNSVALTIDTGPIVSGAPVGTLNQAYITIRICVPGTSTCQTLDHVWIDTGSTGLRIIANSFTPQLPATMQGGSPVGSCGQFISSYTWGALRTADIKIGGETALSTPVQVIGDTTVPAAAPSTCATGTQMATVTDLGANALLGIGVFLQDCGSFCASTAQAGFYYTCPSSGCSSTTMPTIQQLQNVVGLFADNNGSLMQISEVSAQGQATAGGWLTFGINTQSNNQLGSALVFQADPASGNINTNTTYGTTANPSSYIDSGSNGWFIDDPALTVCSGANNSWFCSTAMLAATLTTCIGLNCTGFPAVSNTYDFCIASFNSLNLSLAAFNDLGGPVQPPNSTMTNQTFDWGLPFFYGRSVFTAVEGTTINRVNGPFFAASTP